MHRYFTKAAAVAVVCSLSMFAAACAQPSGGSSKYSTDPVLQKSATQACEIAKGMPNLGSNFNWRHNLTGDFDPSFKDEGTFDWGYLGDRTAQKTYKFTCTGRFDDSHMFADAVLDNLVQTT